MSNEANSRIPLVGGESGEVPGHYGDPLTVSHAATARGGFGQHLTHPLFLLLHGWGSNEQEMADIMRLIAPYNDYVALRGPLTLAPAREERDADGDSGSASTRQAGGADSADSADSVGSAAAVGLGSELSDAACASSDAEAQSPQACANHTIWHTGGWRDAAGEPGNYAWLHGAMPVGEDRDYDAYAAACAVDDWVSANIPADRDIVPLGFSQGGLVAVHLLRINPERYRAVISLSGFNAPGQVPGTAPADDRLADYDIPVFYTYGKNDGVVPKYELFATAAWLEEHTWLKTKSYHGLDHNVSLEEFADLRQWLLDNDITSGVL
ncbi:MULTISPECIES: alpha/beta hydrolase [unclassified Bifidobacterium]|uniref:alpha/beta hydrolase n=1 Tax=unclassified Bifidobacterium TaxID=2608897 RepID=UPI001ECB3848|nr:MULTISPECIES: alpha/beta hydrolase-fold protein [unclassified Bifidobacterium]TPF83477.1 esterase [Bifidobacterium sp. UTCIF-36]TPF92042.1 esterase [Bifidobacterium sp. UTBIF-68]